MSKLWMGTHSLARDAYIIMMNRYYIEHEDKPYIDPGNQFDRWLTDVKAEAWSEGFDAGERDVFEHDRTGWDDSPCIANPYKGENK